MKARSLQKIVIISALIAFVIIATLFLYTRRPQVGVKETIAGLVNPVQPPLMPKPEFVTPQASPAGKPTLENLELVTDQAFAVDGKYMPNSWGVQKNRIVRTTNGDLFTVYISVGSSDKFNREWHLMHKAPGSSWQEIKAGNAGSEPINILRGPYDEIHLFAWPGTQGKLQHLVSRDVGKTFKSEFLPGNWKDDQEQGYSGSGVNAKGNIVFFQTGDDKPGVFNWKPLFQLFMLYHVGNLQRRERLMIIKKKIHREIFLLPGSIVLPQIGRSICSIGNQSICAYLTMIMRRN